MVPILKKDKPAKDPSSYRPISLLPVEGNIVEALILSRFSSYIVDRQLIPCIQKGFRQGQGTDAKKAFGSVWDMEVIHNAMKDKNPSYFL